MTNKISETVLKYLANEPMQGADLRERLKKYGIRKSAPSFYLMMAKLEKCKAVEGFDCNQIIDGVEIKLRWFKITEFGRKWVANPNWIPA